MMSKKVNEVDSKYWRVKVYQLSSEGAGAWHDKGTGQVSLVTPATEYGKEILRSINGSADMYINSPYSMTDLEGFQSCNQNYPIIVVLDKNENKEDNNEGSKLNNSQKNDDKLPAESDSAMMDKDLTTNGGNGNQPQLILCCRVHYAGDIYEMQGESIIMWRESDDIAGEVDYALSFEVYHRDITPFV